VLESTSREIEETVARNLAAGEDNDAARTFWSPVIEGDTAVVEIEVPAGASVEGVALSAPVVSHLVTSPGRNFAMPVAKATAAACENDVMCYGAWSAESNAEARIAFTDSGSSYLCTGTLLADNVPATQVPFFLTANHCISTQASASSMQSWWFWRSTACDSGTRGASQTLTGGATLLYASAVTDTSLMRLNATPPGGAVYAGWTVGAVPGIGASIAGIHHPSGACRRSASATSRATRAARRRGPESFSCRAPVLHGQVLRAAVDERHHGAGQQRLGDLPRERPLPRGAALRRKHELRRHRIGFLRGFDVAYNAGLAPYLNGTSSAPAGSGGTQPVTPAIVPAFDYSALWWNPAESGWGLSITQHQSSLFASWFVYNTDGNSRWVVMPGGTWTTPTTSWAISTRPTARLTTRPSIPTSSSTVRVGTATLSFSSADAGVLNYSVAGVAGQKVIARQAFGVADSTPVASYADLWWNANESGWGVSINQQYRTLFVVWYTYGVYGQPIWYVVPGGSWSGTTYSGTVYRTTAAPGLFFGAAFDPKTVGATAVGTMSLGFNGTGAATMTYTIDGATGSKPITRQPF
jgi:hypothetical protein